MRLEGFGERICVLGPSNSGKSTLAVAIGRALSMPVIHLDVLRHLPSTQWVERADEEFGALHDAAVDGERWVMDGNYSRWLPRRLERATGLILLDEASLLSVARYLRRTWASGARAGGLDGVTDRVSLGMITYILGSGRRNRGKYRRVFDEFAGSGEFVANRRELRAFYRRNSLPDPRIIH